MGGKGGEKKTTGRDSLMHDWGQSGKGRRHSSLEPVKPVEVPRGGRWMAWTGLQTVDGLAGFGATLFGAVPLWAWEGREGKRGRQRQAKGCRWRGRSRQAWDLPGIVGLMSQC